MPETFQYFCMVMAAAFTCIGALCTFRVWEDMPRGQSKDPLQGAVVSALFAGFILGWLLPL